MPSAQNLAALLLLALSSTIPVTSAGGTYSIQQYGGGNDNSLRQVPCNGPFASIPKPTQQFNFIQPEGSGVMRDCIDYTGSDPNPPLVVHEKGYNRYLRGPAPCRDITRIQGSSFRGRSTQRCYGPKIPCAQRAQLRYCIWSAEHRMFDSAKPVSEEKPWCRDISHPHPTPMQECDCITRVTIWDKSHFRSDPDRPCRQIAQAAGITVSQILAWNPWIGDKCGEGLFAGMEPNTYEKRSVCIGVKPAAEHTEDSEAKLGDGADL